MITYASCIPNNVLFLSKLLPLSEKLVLKIIESSIYLIIIATESDLTCS